MASVMAASVLRRTLLRRCVPVPHVARGYVSGGYGSRRGYSVDPMQDAPKDRFEGPETLRPSLELGKEKEEEEEEEPKHRETIATVTVRNSDCADWWARPPASIS